MKKQTLECKDYWRTLILFGKNTSTYKIALGHCLSNYVDKGKTFVSMKDLAKDFFVLYFDRLQKNKPQIDDPRRKTVVEKQIELFKLKKISKEEAVEKIKAEGFRYVIDCFHTIDKFEIPVKFYEKVDHGLVLTDNLFQTFEGEKKDKETLKNELNSRWDLLEAAFEIKINDSKLVNDIRRFYLERGYERKSVTEMRNVLNGYQNDICFYCGEKMVGEIHVDHVIPRQFYYRDDVWNLVLAHDYCNLQKSDYLPAEFYIEKLIQRNEYLIMSNHPLKKKLIEQLGKTPESRIKFVWKIYEDARQVLPIWKGIKGYKPTLDSSFKIYAGILNQLKNKTLNRV